MTRQCSVYWIHKPIHTNPFTEGYIGISYNPQERWTGHKWKAKRSNTAKIHKILNKYDDLQFKVLIVGSREYCLMMEQSLRPTPNIAWNIAIGGDDSTIQATEKSKLTYANRRRMNACHYWYKAEMIMLRTILKQQRIEAKLKAKQLKKEQSYITPRQAHKASASGVVGVSYFPKYDMYRAQICMKKQLKTVGYYPSIDKAKQAYDEVFKYKAEVMTGQATLDSVVQRAKEIHNLKFVERSFKQARH